MAYLLSMGKRSGHGDSFIRFQRGHYDNRTELKTERSVVRGFSVGIYQDSLPHEIAYNLNHYRARFVVVEDQEQVDKLLEVEDEIPHVERIIYSGWLKRIAYELG